MVCESIEDGNDVTCHAVPVVLFLVFRKKNRCYRKKQIEHNLKGSKLCSETTRLRLVVPLEF